uniref:Inter-alpha-trypsin inhibitor heavy chain family member 6 n=1 Tax=Mus spicilegus TaxID=10103 RepID=A0A8C6GXR7_MUSSI
PFMSVFLSLGCPHCVASQFYLPIWAQNGLSPTHLSCILSQLLMMSYSIRSTVVSRYAHTLVTSVLFNPHDEAHEAIFDLNLPRIAFISNFTMTIDDKIYVAEIKEKHQAKKMYEKAYQQGKTAAHVAGTKATFALAYEELLQRHQGRYQLVVSLRPGQLVRKLNVEITVSERTGIAYVHIPPLRTSQVWSGRQGEGDLPPSTRIQRGETCVHITFSPTLRDQSAFSSSGIMADFTIHYDVSMEDIIGDVQVYGGYFIHYFAPRGLQPLEKNVVFVIDVSGSMFGTKLQQTKKAMDTILSDLQASDSFNIITFSDTVNIWKAEGSIQATVQNIHSAKNYSTPRLGTDINAALLAAASVLNHSNQEPGKGRGVGQIPLIMFLTDGEPTAGETTPSVILSNIRQALAHRVSLFSLAFGDDADFSLLRRLSLENQGEARRIYEDADAALQLEGLYAEISRPLLADVHLDYLGGWVGASSRAHFPNYFHGSELVVAGKVQPGEQEVGIHLAARGPNGHLLVAHHSEEASNSSQKAFGCPGKPALNVTHFIHRLWAYVTIGELLKARFQAKDTTTRRLLAAKALNLSLEYNFVTPLTSLVVVHLEKTNEEAMTQPSTTAKTSTVTPSSSNRLGLGTGTLCMPTPWLTSPSPIFISCLTVDGDPHFVIHIPHSEEKICFTLDGRPGDLLKLIDDPKAGLHVSGQLLGAPSRPSHKDQTRTYFHIITITSDKPRAYNITISRSSISVQGESTLSLSWNQRALVKKPHLELHVASAALLTLRLGPHLNFFILRHQYRHPSTLQLPHLGFYVVNGSGLSPSARGLMGQFQYTDIRLVTGPSGSYLQKHHGLDVPVVLGKRLLKESPRLLPRWTSCWIVKRSHVERLLGQPYLAYVL